MSLHEILQTASKYLLQRDDAEVHWNMIWVNIFEKACELFNRNLVIVGQNISDLIPGYFEVLL